MQRRTLSVPKIVFCDYDYEAVGICDFVTVTHIRSGRKWHHWDACKEEDSNFPVDSFHLVKDALLKIC